MAAKIEASTPLEALDKKHFAKGAAPAAARSKEEGERLRGAAREAALLEAKVGRAVVTLAGWELHLEAILAYGVCCQTDLKGGQGAVVCGILRILQGSSHNGGNGRVIGPLL